MNGDYYNCSTNFDDDIYEFIRIPAKSNKGQNPLDGTEVVASLPYTGDPSYYHCFGMTERFFIFIESSMKLQSYFKSKYWNEVALKLLNKTHADMMKFIPDMKSRSFLLQISFLFRVIIDLFGNSNKVGYNCVKK